MFMLHESRIRMLIVSLTTSVYYVSPSPFSSSLHFFCGSAVRGRTRPFLLFLAFTVMFFGERVGVTPHSPCSGLCNSQESPHEETHPHSCPTRGRSHVGAVTDAVKLCPRWSGRWVHYRIPCRGEQSVVPVCWSFECHGAM